MMNLCARSILILPPSISSVVPELFGDDEVHVEDIPVSGVDGVETVDFGLECE